MKQFKRAFSGRLGKQFAIQIVLFSSCFTLISTSIQLAFDYHVDINRIDQQLIDINNSHVPSLSLALWLMDTPQLKTHLSGIERLPDVEYVAVIDDRQTVWEAGTRKSENVREKSYNLQYDYLDDEGAKPLHLGKLVVTASIDNVYDRLINRASVILVSNGIKTFVVASFIMLLIWLKVTRHLQTVAEYVSSLDVNEVNKPLRLSKKIRREAPDEFDVVTDAINHMNQSLYDSFQELRSAELSLQSLLRERDALLDTEREYKDQLEEKVIARTEELTRSEEALKQNQQHLQNILETSPIAVGVFDTKNRKMVFSNDTCAHMFGFLLAEWLQHDPINSWANSVDRDRYILEFKETGRVQTNEVLLVRKDGSEFWALLTWEKIIYQGVPHVLFWVVNIDDQKQTQLELKQAKEEAENATRSKSEFLANMSHEIRTPMNAVVGFSHLALQTKLSDQQYDYISKIQLAGHNLLRVINDILDLSKIESGRLEVESIGFSLDDVLEHLCDLLRLKAEEKGLEILLFHPWELPRNLKGDPLRLGQVLTNLVSNAIKFTEQGEVSIRVEEISRTKQHVMMKFEVQDSGIGISEEEVRRLFKPFGQADSSTTRRYGGSGLGLVISKQLVEMMGGEIWVDSNKGRGSCFAFTCQFELNEETENAEGTVQSLQGTRVLIVDDSEASRDVLSSIVCNFGMYSYTVESGEAAITELQRAADAGEPAYDLLLLDWHMPGIDGMECAHQIKMMSHNEPMPALVMVTAHNREDILQNAQSDHLDGFLLKPVSPSLLLSAILSALDLESTDVRRHPQPESRHEQSLAGILGARILVVEDNPTNQQIATEMLEGLGVHVTVSDNGKQALQRVEDEQFDLILMDIQMPVMDGLEATKQIRLLEKGQGLPIVAMTANAMQEDYDRSIAAGMDDHLNKPIQPEQLFTTLSHWIAPGRHLQKMPVPQIDAPCIEGLDTEAGMARLNGNMDLYHKLLRQFTNEQRNAVYQVRCLLGQECTDAAADQIHTLAGLCGNLGADKLFQLARELEVQLRKTPEKNLSSSLQEIEAELLKQIHSISSYLDSLEQVSSLSADSHSSGEFSSSKFSEVCEQLRPMLEEGDSGSTQLVSELEKLLAGESGEHFKQLQNAVDDYEFDEALLALDILEAERQ